MIHPLLNIKNSIHQIYGNNLHVTFKQCDLYSVFNNNKFSSSFILRIIVVRYAMSAINDIGVLPAITHANNMRLSPKYIGCLTTRYKNLVLIGEIMGITAKLPLNEQSDNNKMMAPIMKTTDAISTKGCNSSINLTTTMLHTIINSQ